MAEEHEGTESRSVCVPARGTAGDPALSVPRGLGSADHAPRKKLILHMDLNNTILVSDTVTGQGTVAALDYFLTTVTWGKMSKHGKNKARSPELIVLFLEHTRGNKWMEMLFRKY